MGDYAKSFGKANPVNKLVTDSIRVSNQWLVGLSALISSFNYFKMGRLVAPLGMCLAIGGVGGSWLIPALTAGKVNLKAYIGYFGLIVLLLGIMLLRETTASGQAKKAGDELAYKGINNLANEAFGKSFFLLMATGMASIWPAFFAAAWMHRRFNQLGYSLPSWLGGFEINSIAPFILLYVLSRLLVGRIRRLKKAYCNETFYSSR